MKSEYSEFIDLANLLADVARVLIREATDQARQPIRKGDGSPVTVTDRAVEGRLRAMIGEAYPNHGIIGQERGSTGTKCEWVWVIDPIDGTLPFMAGFPVFGCLIALLHGDAPVLGVIEMPMTGERWVGCRDLPSTLNGLPIRTRACENLSRALMSTSNPDFYAPGDRPALDRMRQATRWSVYGGSCMAYAQIASGRIDVGFDVQFDIYDYLALVPVIQGAGGVITDWDGRPLDRHSGDRFLAAGNPAIHDQARRIIAGAR